MGGSVAKTTLKAFSDGFGCMAVTDVAGTDNCIIQLMNRESPWEVIDGIEKLPAGHYLVTITFWYEDNFPEAGRELMTEVIKSELQTKELNNGS